MLRKLWYFFKNPFILVTLFFMVWLLFFDNNNLISKRKQIRQLKELQDKKKYFEEEIRKDSVAMQDLMSDSDKLERFAREKYLMKKDNEDIFLIIEED